MNRLIFSAAVTAMLAFNLTAQDNIIQNGCFLDTNSNVWVFRTNGANATRSYQVMQSTNGTIISRKCKIEITAKGNSENAPQLIQSGINLEEGQGYKLSFMASSSRNGTIRAVIGTENTVLTDSASGLMNTTANFQKYTLSFFVENNITNATLQLNMGLYEGATNIAIDSIFLIKDSKPTIRIVAPTSKDRWISGTERQITWKNSGVLDKVKIQYSDDKSASWKVVTQAATNQKSFWWKVPANVFGDSCKIIVSSVDGTTADTSDAFKILESGSVEVGELIKNGDFLDTTDWKLNAYSPAKATGKIQNGQYVVKIDTVGTEAWQTQLEQRDLTLKMGKTYKFQFDAYSTRQRNIQFNIGEQDSPYRSALGLPVNIQIGNEKDTYTYYYNLDSASLPVGINLDKIRVEFNCGLESGFVYFDNISLVEVDVVKSMIVKPSVGSILKAGAEFNIQWIGESTTPEISLDYSLDSGITWNPIADSIANLQAYLWIVPIQSSKNCQIRIKNAVNDSVMGQSAIFQINKFGVPAKLGELVTNGSFTNNLAGWHTSFNGAYGQAVVTGDGMFSTETEAPGDSFSNIILSQGDMNVLGGTEYTFSFKAFANGTRDMKVKILGDDSISLLDTTFTVPNLNETISFKLTPANDVIAKAEFHIGGSRAAVFIDDISFHTSAWTGVIGKNVIAKNRTVAFNIRNIGLGNICFSVGKNVQGQIAVYNLNGSLVRMLKVSEKVLWDGKDSHGLNVARGTYVARLKSNFGSTVNKFIMR